MQLSKGDIDIIVENKIKGVLWGAVLGDVIGAFL